MLEYVTIINIYLKYNYLLNISLNICDIECYFSTHSLYLDKLLIPQIKKQLELSFYIISIFNNYKIENVVIKYFIK